MMSSFICKLFILIAFLSITSFAAPGLFEYPSRSVRLIRSDPAATYDGYENSFYRGYGADQPFRFGNAQLAW